HGVRHDDGRGAGDRDEADLEVLLLQRAGLRKDLGRGLQRKELRQGGERAARADGFQEGPARLAAREHRPHHGGGDDAFVTLLFAFDGGRLERERRADRRIVLAVGAVTAAATAGPAETNILVERINKARQPSSPWKNQPPPAGIRSCNGYAN